MGVLDVPSAEIAHEFCTRKAVMLPANIRQEHFAHGPCALPEKQCFLLVALNEAGYVFGSL